MKFVTYGDRNRPVIVLNNGSFCSERSLAPIAEGLAGDFHVVVAVLDGNDGGSEPYVSTEHQAQRILDGLAGMGVTRVAVLQGLSMGAEVALEVLRQVDVNEGAGAGIEVHQAFFDGGPFLHLSSLMQKIMLKKFSGMVGRMASKSEEASITSFLQNKMIKRMIGDAVDGYEPMLRDVWRTAQTISDEQVRGQVDTCYTCELLPFDEARQRSMLFQWCEREKARDSERRVREAYPSADFRIVPGLGHGGMAVLRPAEYVAQIRELAEAAG